MYSPVLAALLTPNVLLGEWWGKALFAACDCAVGVMIMRLLRRHPLQLPLACTWLLNPIVVNVSTRGNAEGFVAVWAVASLYAFERRRYNAAAVLLGIAAHIKIYPVVYGVPMALFLLRAQQSPDFAPKDFVQRAGSAAAFGASACAQFVCRSLSARDPRTVAAATFIAITSLCYAVYGYAFLFEVLRAPLYPLRTSLSLSHSPPCSGLLVPLRPLRYPPQLRSSFPSNVRGSCRPPLPTTKAVALDYTPSSSVARYLDVSSAPQFGKSAFLPQAVAVVAAGAALSFDVPFALFIQTLSFVALNKVYVVCAHQPLPMRSPRPRAAQVHGAVLRVVFLFPASSARAAAPAAAPPLPRPLSRPRW